MKTLLVIILCLLSSFIYSQNKLKNRLEGFEKMILDSLYSNYDNKISGYDLDQYNIRIIPSLYYNFNNDSINQFEFNSSTWDLIAIHKNLKDTIWLYSCSYCASGIGETKWGSTWDVMKILNKSKYCFFIYCVRKESSSRKLIGFIENGKIKIEDYYFNYFQNINEAIKYHWGSIEKAKDIENIEKIKDDFLKNTTVDEAKDILRNSYTDCYRLYPKDTLLILGTYLNELEATIQLYDGQKDFLNRLIQKNIKIKDRETIKNPEYEYFMDNFISWELLTTLTVDQYYDFKKNKYFITKKINMSRDILRNYFVNNLKKPLEQFDEFLRKEVFKK